MRILDRVVAGLVVAFGALHCGMTFAIYPSYSEAAMWFFSAGLALLLLGAINLLRIQYGAVAPGLVRVCVAANLAFLGFAGVYAAARASKIVRDPGAMTLLAVLAAATILSVRDLMSKRASLTSPKAAA